MNTFNDDRFRNDIVRQNRQATVLSQLMHNRPALLVALKQAYESEQDLIKRVQYGNLMVWLRLLKGETNGA